MKAPSIIPNAPSLDAATVHAMAMQLVDEIVDKESKVFCVASGGVSFASASSNCTEANLFEVIKDITGEHPEILRLREHINALAAAAGLTLA